MRIMFQILAGMAIMLLSVGCGLVHTQPGYELESEPAYTSTCTMYNNKSQGYRYVKFRDCVTDNSCYLRKFTEAGDYYSRRDRDYGVRGTCTMWHNKSKGYRYVIFETCRYGNECSIRKFYEDEDYSHKHRHRHSGHRQAQELILLTCPSLVEGSIIFNRRRYEIS